MMTKRKTAPLGLTLCLLLAACGPGDEATGGPLGSANDKRVAGVIAGQVYVTAPVKGAVVTAYKYDLASGAQGDKVAESQPTDDAGRFNVAVGIYFGPVILVASGASASYREPATGAVVSWDSNARLRTVYSSVGATGITNWEFRRGDGAINFLITPWTDLALTYAEARHQRGGDAMMGDALRRAYDLFAEHLEQKLAEGQPVNLAEVMAEGVNDETRAGAVFAGLSMFVKRSEASGLTSMNLLQVLREDLSDRKLNGKDVDRQLVFGSCKNLCVLSSQTMRSELANSIAVFLDSSGVNKSTIGSKAVSEMLSRIAKRQSELFPDGSPTVDFDTTAPTIEVIENKVNDEEGAVIKFEENPLRAVYQVSTRTVALVESMNIAKFSKFSSTYLENDKNLPAWRYLVKDNRTADDAIRLEARLLRKNGDNFEPLGDWFTVAHAAGAGFNREIVVSTKLSDVVGTKSGIYRIETRATDMSENASEIKTVSWEQKILAPPVRQRAVGCDPCLDAQCPSRFSLGPQTGCGSVSGYNALPLLNAGDAGLPEQRVLVGAVAIENPTPAAVRVRLNVEAHVRNFVRRLGALRFKEASGAEPGRYCGDGFNELPDTNICIGAPSPTPQEYNWDHPYATSRMVHLGFGFGPTLAPCQGCGPDEYLIPKNGVITVRIFSQPWHWLSKPLQFIRDGQNPGFFADLFKTVLGCPNGDGSFRGPGNCLETDPNGNTFSRTVALYWWDRVIGAKVTWDHRLEIQSRPDDNQAAPAPALGPAGEAADKTHQMVWESYWY